MEKEAEKALTRMASSPHRQKSIGDVRFTKKRRAETPQPDVEINNFKR
jgi:hypothetical protein